MFIWFGFVCYGLSQIKLQCEDCAELLPNTFEHIDDLRGQPMVIFQVWPISFQEILWWTLNSDRWLTIFVFEGEKSERKIGINKEISSFKYSVYYTCSYFTFLEIGFLLVYEGKRKVTFRIASVVSGHYNMVRLCHRNNISQVQMITYRLLIWYRNVNQKETSRIIIKWLWQFKREWGKWICWSCDECLH